jgi:IPT/TIG domain
MRRAVVMLIVGGCNRILGLDPAARSIEIGSITPVESTISGGTMVAITGSNLGAVDSVTFGDVQAEIANTSNDEVDVVAPPHPAGIVDIVVAADAQHVSVTKQQAFTYRAVAFVKAVAVYLPATGSLPYTLSIPSAADGDLLVGVTTCGGNQGGLILGTPSAMFASSSVIAWGYGYAQVLHLPVVGGGDVMITASSNGAAVPCRILVAEYSGARRLYGVASRPGTTSGPGSFDLAGLVVAQALPDDVVLTVALSGNDATYSPGPGFTERPTSLFRGFFEDTSMAVTAANVVATMTTSANADVTVLLGAALSAN